MAAWTELGNVRGQLADARHMRDTETDDELKAMARDEIAELEGREDQLLADLRSPSSRAIPTTTAT